MALRIERICVYTGQEMGYTEHCSGHQGNVGTLWLSHSRYETRELRLCKLLSKMIKHTSTFQEWVIFYIQGIKKKEIFHHLSEFEI